MPHPIGPPVYDEGPKKFNKYDNKSMLLYVGIILKGAIMGDFFVYCMLQKVLYGNVKYDRTKHLLRYNVLSLDISLPQVKVYLTFIF